MTGYVHFLFLSTKSYFLNLGISGCYLGTWYPIVFLGNLQILSLPCFNSLACPFIPSASSLIVVS
ncbi:hypothetical protein HanRHA438_Chr03g0104071 [Helianthus annuus]|nr:hypothetical protein HanRHA438_Chr03g0104071 [Helianthus annuus]